MRAFLILTLCDRGKIHHPIPPILQLGRPDSTIFPAERKYHSTNEKAMSFVAFWSPGIKITTVDSKLDWFLDFEEY